MILAADDDARNRVLLGLMLKHHGLPFELVASGEEVLERVAKQAPSLVLLDVRMPGLGGLETLSRLRERHPDLPVMLISAHGDLDTSIEAMRRGASDFLIRPLQDDELAIRIDRAIERQRAENELRASNWRFARLWERVLNAQEDERRRLARELHDQAGTSLAAMMLTCHTLATAASMDEVRRAASQLGEDLRATLDELARLARGLHPVVIDELGLMPALTRAVDELGRRAGLDIETDLDVELARVPPEVEVAVFRVAQEAFTNIVRHASARAIRVMCQREGERLVLKISDDGCGFDPSEHERFMSEGRLGLAGIRDRVALLGGDVALTSAPGHGTELVVRVPYAAPAKP